jgi:hypothetical protein
MIRKPKSCAGTVIEGISASRSAWRTMYVKVARARGLPERLVIVPRPVRRSLLLLRRQGYCRCGSLMISAGEVLPASNAAATRLDTASAVARTISAARST